MPWWNWNQLKKKGCIKKILLSNYLQELMELHQESEEEVTDIEQAENWFSLTSAQRICAYSNQFSSADMFLALDKDMNGTLSKQELREYVDGTLTDIFIERAFDEHVRHGKTGGGNAREMDFESFLDFVLALENKDTPEGLTYLFQCLDLCGRGYLTKADIHTLFSREIIFSKKRENRKNDRRTEFTVRHVFAVSREFAVSYRL
ncbi:unnamed protein product [Camellia sinensis]